MPFCVRVRAVQLALVIAVTALGAASPAIAGTLEQPIDRSHQTEFGARSHWLQPWRADLDTWPARRMRRAVGINFNVDPEDADRAARLLAAAGFTRARVEIDWGKLSYDDPNGLRDEGGMVRLRALARHGIRPLILLNSWHGEPAPRRRWHALLEAAAPAGATTVRLDPDAAAQVRPGRSGLDRPDGSKAAEVLFTGVEP